MLTIRQVEAFRATVMTGSVTRAADHLNISQPSISRLLGDMEHALGFKLFSRHKKGLSPTAEARLLFEEVERMFTGLDHLERTGRHIRDMACGQLSIGIIPAFAFDALPETLKQADGGGVPDITLRVRSTRQILEWVQAHQLDLGLISPSGDLPGVTCMERRDYRCMCLLPADHPLARQEEALDLYSMKGEKFITPNSEFMSLSSPDPRSLAFLQDQSRISIQVSFGAAALVRKGLGITIVDPFTAQFFTAFPDLVAKPLLQEFSYPVALIRPSGRPPSILAESYALRIMDILDRTVSPDPITK